jgi:hypothetical protein
MFDDGMEPLSLKRLPSMRLCEIFGGTAGLSGPRPTIAKTVRPYILRKELATQEIF